MATATRPGRPRARSAEEPRQYVGFAVPLALKAQLEGAARDNGRSLAQECVARLERSFHAFEDFKQAFDGDAGFRWAVLLFAGFKAGGEARVDMAAAPWEWVRDAGAFEAALSSTVRTAWVQHPGQPTLDDMRRWLER